MAKDIEKEKDQKISKHKFFFETALYTPIKIVDLETDLDTFFYGGVDAYNPNGFETTYGIKIEGFKRTIYAGHTSYEHLANFDNFSAVSLVCRRKGDVIKVIVYNDGEFISKIGQIPTIADLQYAEIGKKYDKILPKNDLHDLKKAIGLMAHGAGAGSLVYLRRIFENIIFNTYEKHKGVLAISDEEFKKKRMDEKVEFLKNYLPSQLVEMRAVYGILSKGVHELSEDECLAYFPALKLSIMLILDQRIEGDAKAKKDAETKKAVDNIATQVNGKK